MRITCVWERLCVLITYNEHRYRAGDCLPSYFLVMMITGKFPGVSRWGGREEFLDAPEFYAS